MIKWHWLLFSEHLHTRFQHIFIGFLILLIGYWKLCLVPLKSNLCRPRKLIAPPKIAPVLQKITWYFNFPFMEDILFTYILYNFLIPITRVKNFKYEWKISFKNKLKMLICMQRSKVKTDPKKITETDKKEILFWNLYASKVKCKLLPKPHPSWSFFRFYRVTYCHMFCKQALLNTTKKLRNVLTGF